MTTFDNGGTLPSATTTITNRTGHAEPVGSGRAQDPRLLAGRNWWSIENSADKARTAVVDIYDEIGPWGVTAKEFVRQLRSLDVDEIQLHVSSPGGDVFDGVAILNALRTHSARVVATVDSIAASAASFIVMGADEVVMARNSELMIHDAFGFAVGDSDVMRELADRLDQVSNNIAAIYAEKAGGTADDWRTAMRAETWYTADEAVAAGLADRVAVKETKPGAAEAKNRFDYSIFNYAGRQAAPPPPIVPSISARTQSALPAGQGQPEKEGAAVTDTAKLREDLGLAPDAPNDQVLAAVFARLAESPPAATPASTPAPVAPQASAEAPAASPEPTPADDQPTTLIVSKSVWEEQQRTLASMKDFIDKTKRDERDSVLAQAVTDGKFTPAQLNDFKKSWDANPDNTRDIVARLTPNSALAVAAAGYANDAEGDSLDAEFAGLFPPAWKDR